MTALFKFLIFPGLLFAVVMGMFASWLVRKVSARVQWRVGPPLLQPLYDLVKLSQKEMILPEGRNPAVFLLAPLLGFAGVAVVAVILGALSLSGHQFMGDLIVVLYLLTVPSLALIIGGASTGNPLAAVGTAREMKLILAYELPFLLAVTTTVIKAGYSLSLGQIASHAAIWSISGFLSFLVAVLCIQAKLGFAPFEIAEAETEISAGPLIEYSGPPLAIFKLTHMLLLFLLPLLLTQLYLGGFTLSMRAIIPGLIKLFVVLLLVILIKNTNPRLRIDQALKFFWTTATALALISMLLAFIGGLQGLPWL